MTSRNWLQAARAEIETRRRCQAVVDAMQARLSFQDHAPLSRRIVIDRTGARFAEAAR